MSKFNKVITNVPVPLDETEVENLSQTLSGLLNGGGGEGKIYEGDGVYIDVDNTRITGKITLTQTAKTKLDTPIPTQVSDLTDSANYETTEHANATYLTQASADTLYAPVSVSGDIEYLSGEFNNYYKKTETSSKEQLSDEFEKYQLKTDMEDYVMESTFYGAVEELENEKQNKLTFGYNSESAISSINGSALAGKETTPYDYGTDLIIDEYTIKVNTNGTANNFGKSFVEGQDTKAGGAASHAEGKETSALSDYSHTEGYKNIDYEIPGQIGSNHIEGAYNNASGVYTHVEGHANGASGYGLHVQGGYNRFYINNTAADITHSDPTDRWNIWGISIEGMANATTAEPISGYDSEGHPLYVHGGILKVIGNGTRTKPSEDPSSESITRSDALIIYRDGCISAAGNISANGIELGAGGGGTSYQGRNGVNVNGGYVELTTTAYNAVTSVSSKVDKPDTTQVELNDKYLVYSTLSAEGQPKGWVDMQTKVYSKTEADGTFQKKTDMGGYLTTAQYSTDSATFVTETELETVSGEITALIPTNYVTSGDYISGDSQYALTTAGWAKISGGDYVPYSATKLAIGSNNDISENNSDNTFAQGTNNKIATSPYSFVQGVSNSAVNSYSLAQGYSNYAQDIALAQGSNNTAITVSFAQGQHNTSTSYTFTQGTHNSALTTSFAQGSANKAKSDSLAQGNSNSAFTQSFAQGHYNSADDGSLAQGKYNTAYSHSFAQGAMNYAVNNALAQGGDNTAKYFSQALGFGLSIQGSRGHEDGTDYISGGLAIGIYNQTSSNVAFVVGNGHSNGSLDPTRSDAFVIYPDGSVSAAGKISANGVELGSGGGTSFTGVTTAGSISGDGLTNPLGLKTSAENALTSVSNKVDKPTSLVNKYLVLRTDNSGDVSGWYDFTDQYYNKDQANSRFVATAYIDTTLSGNGNASNRKLGVDTDVIATKDYVNSSFLPTSGGTVSGQLVVSGGSNFDQENLKLIRTGLNGYGRIGLASNGALAVKVDDNNSNTTQINIAANASNNELIQVQHGGTTAYLIPAVTSTTTAGLTNDGILHIILES